MLSYLIFSFSSFSIALIPATIIVSILNPQNPRSPRFAKRAFAGGGIMIVYSMVLIIFFAAIQYWYLTSSISAVSDWRFVIAGAAISLLTLYLDRTVSFISTTQRALSDNAGYHLTMALNLLFKMFCFVLFISALVLPGSPAIQAYVLSALCIIYFVYMMIHRARMKKVR